MWESQWQRDLGVKPEKLKTETGHYFSGLQFSFFSLFQPLRTRLRSGIVSLSCLGMGAGLGLQVRSSGLVAGIYVSGLTVIVNVLHQVGHRIQGLMCMHV